MLSRPFRTFERVAGWWLVICPKTHVMTCPLPSLVPDTSWRTVELVGMEMSGRLPLPFFFEEGVSWMLEYFVSSSHSTVIYKSCFELFSILFHIFRHFRPMIFPTYLPSVAPEKWLRMPSNVRLIAQGKFPPEAETPGILPRISLHSSWFLASMIGKCCVAAGWNMLKIPSKNCQQEM